MKKRLLLWLFVADVMMILACPFAEAQQVLHGDVPADIMRLHLLPKSRLQSTNILHLCIGLPLRNQNKLNKLLQEIYDPDSRDYHHFLTPERFTELFGPAERDYQSLITFAETNGWTITRRDPARILLGINAAVADVERVCHLKMQTYEHPIEARTFFAPDREPTLDFTPTILNIRGLNNYVMARPAGIEETSPAIAQSAAGSGPGGSIFGDDFRAAYVPDVFLDGTGQTVGLLEFNGFYSNDITAYEEKAGLPNVPIIIYPMIGSVVSPTNDTNALVEPPLDIEMAISMAPGLSQVVVYEAESGAYANEMLCDIASNNVAKQISSSWFFEPDATTDNLFQKLAMQGQSFFQASGDEDAYIGGITFENHAGPPADDTNITSVGGTTLTMTSGGYREGETVWNNWTSGTGTNGSGGGISSIYEMPTWQKSTSMAANGGSSTNRNIPDVAMAADNILVFYNNGNTTSAWGTSCAAPLWAGFTALVNQQRAAFGNTPIGFINPAVYAIGNGPGYAAAFHDITLGNNTNLFSTNLFNAVPGYDLCTGWGSPNGMNLINALSSSDPLFISPANGFDASGAVGGPFNITNQTFYFTNLSLSSFFWSASSDSSLLTAAPANGLLLAKQGTNLTVSITSNANSLFLGKYSGSIIFSNLTLGTEQIRQFTIQAGLAPLTFDDLNTSSTAAIPAGYGGLDWSNFRVLNATNNDKLKSGYHAGIISQPNVAFNGDANPATIIGLAPFDFLSAYLTSAWNDGLDVEVKGYAGTTLEYDNTYVLSATEPTLIQFNYFGVSSVTFISSNGTPHNGYDGNGEYFVMDNVSVVTHNTQLVAPVLHTIGQNAGTIAFDWITRLGDTYQVQYSTNLLNDNWSNLGSTVTATNSVLGASESEIAGQMFYRLITLP